jgi:hypothetical protein
MANGGYIGKISALVTASTADLERKLRGSATEVDRFGKSIGSVIGSASRSAQTSLNGIFTPLQKIQRALDIGRNSRLALIDDTQLRKIQQAVSITEQLNKPLTSASRSFQSLSSDIQAGFLPALIRAQDAVVRANEEIATTGGVTSASFGVAQRAIDQATAAIERFRQAESLIAGGPTGRELQFTSPDVFERLQSSAATRQSAADPRFTRAIGGDASRLVSQLTEIDRAIVSAQSRLESIRLTPRVDDRELLKVQGEIQDLLARSRQAEAELKSRLSGVAAETSRGFILRGAPQARPQLGLFGAQSGTDEERAVERARALDAEFRKLPATAQAGIGSLAGIASRLADEVSATGAGASQLNAVLDLLQSRLTSTASAADEQAERVRRSGDAAREAAAKMTSLAQAIQASLGNARPTVDSLEQDFRRLLGIVESSPGGQGAFKPILDDLLELFTAARNGASNIDEIIAKLNELRAAGAAGASGRLTILSDAEVQADKAKRAADEIAKTRSSLAQRLESGFGGAGTAGLNLGIDEKSLRGIAGEFEFLQTKIAGVSAETRGPLVAAMEQYRQVVTRAFKDGTISTKQGQAAIAQARGEVIRLGADLLRVSPAKFGDQLSRAGDVARGFGSKFGLAMQQAVFAVDDFFSVTGGLDQRIRAAGNNISQLGFILGGTAGLIAGVTVAIGGQLVAAVIRYRNGLISARDEAESLNKTLEDQRKAVVSVGETFDAFIGRIVDSAFSESTRRANEFSASLDEIVKKLRQIEAESIASLDPDVIRERALQQSLQRRTGEARNVADILALQAAIDASRQREQAAGQRANDRGPARQEDFSRVTDSFRDALARALTESNDSFGGFNLRNFLGRDSFESAFGARGNSLAGALQPAIGSLIDLSGFGDDVRRAAGIQSADRVNQLAAVGEATRLRVANAAGDEDELLAAIGPLREELDRLILSAGIADQGLVDFARSARESIARLEASLASPAFREANKIFEEQARGLRNVGTDLEQVRRSAEQAAEAGLEGARALGANAEQLAGQLKTASDALKAARESGDPEAARAAAGELEAIRGRIDTARREAVAIDTTREALGRFAAALDRVSQEAQADLQQSQQDADEARRRDIAFSTPASRQDRQRAEADFARQRELTANVASEVAAARERFRAGDVAPELEALVRRIRQIGQALQGNIAPAQREELVRERARLEQQAVAVDGRARAAGDAAAAAREQTSAAARGRDLLVSPAERAGRELAQSFADIAAEQESILERSGGLPNAELEDFGARAREAEARLTQDAFRAVAPGLAALGDAVANAIASGPSRAALNVSDASTVEGQRELNRLLRGDDSARDQDLVELQRQTKALETLVRQGEQKPAVAN